MQDFPSHSLCKICGFPSRFRHFHLCRDFRCVLGVQASSGVAWSGPRTLRKGGFVVPAYWLTFVEAPHSRIFLIEKPNSRCQTWIQEPNLKWWLVQIGACHSGEECTFEKTTSKIAHKIDGWKTTFLLEWHLLKSYVTFCEGRFLKENMQQGHDGSPTIPQRHLDFMIFNDALHHGIFFPLNCNQFLVCVILCMCFCWWLIYDEVNV